MDIGDGAMSPEQLLMSPRADYSQDMLNINDVIEAIHLTDPTWPQEGSVGPELGPNAVGASMGPLAAGPGAVGPSGAERITPWVRIVEQPHPRHLRFRYKCEGRSAGSIPGVNSSSDKRTFPTIEVIGYRGKATVLVSCVTADEPYLAHPHNLVGRPDRCDQGVCKVHVDLADSPFISFSNLGVQCVKKKDINRELTLRESLKVDPFRRGFEHKKHPQTIDLNVVRLCFQVVIRDEHFRKVALKPVVSEKVYDKKATSELLIMRVSRCSGPAAGGTDMILLCDKVSMHEIEVVFFEGPEEAPSWEAAANVVLVHRQVAIAFTTPPYKNPTTTENHTVKMQLRRKTDKSRSPTVFFEYIPFCPDTAYLHGKGVKRISPFLQSNMFFTEQKLLKLEPRERPPSQSSPRHAPLEPNAQPTEEWLSKVQNISRSLQQQPVRPPRALHKAMPRLPPTDFPMQIPRHYHYQQTPGTMISPNGRLTEAAMPSPTGSMASPGSMLSPVSMASPGSMTSRAGSMPSPETFMNLATSSHVPAGTMYVPGMPKLQSNMHVVPSQMDVNHQYVDHGQDQSRVDHNLDQLDMMQIGLHQLADIDASIINLVDKSANDLLNPEMLSLPSLPPSTEFKTFDFNVDQL